MTDLSLSFANNFWGKDDAGVDRLLQRMHDAKQTCEEIHLYFKERMSIEEEYSRRMLALSRKKLGSAETGNLKTTLEVIRSSTESMGKSHASCHKQIKTQLDEPLEAFAASLRSRRKTTESTIEKLTKAKQLQNSTVEKARSKFEMDCNKINGYSAQKNLLMGKELERNNMKLDKVHASVDNSRREYQTSLRVLAETIDQWNKEWKLSCDKFQDLEEERINFLKSNLWAYTNIVSTVCVGDDEVCETIRLALEKCDVQQDIETFVKEKGTGSDIMDPPEFINFLGGYSRDSTSDQFRVANFNRDVTDSIPTLEVPGDSYDRASQASPAHGSATSASSSVYSNSVSSASTDQEYEEPRYEEETQTKRRSWASPFVRKKKDTAPSSPQKSASRQSFADVPEQDEDEPYSADTITSKSPFAQRYANTRQEEARPDSRSRPSTNGRASAVLSMGDNMFDLDDAEETPRRARAPPVAASAPSSNLRNTRDDPLVAALERLKMNAPSSTNASPSGRGTGGTERRGLSPPGPAFTADEMEATSNRYSAQTSELFGGERRPHQQQQMNRPKSSVELRQNDYSEDYTIPQMSDNFDNHDPYHARPKSTASHRDPYGAFESNPYGRTPSPNPYDRRQAHSDRAVSPSPARMQASPSANVNSAAPRGYAGGPMRSHSPSPAQMRSQSPAPGNMKGYSPAGPAMRGYSPAPSQQMRSHSPAPSQQMRSHSPAPGQQMRAQSPSPYAQQNQMPPQQQMRPRSKSNVDLSMSMAQGGRPRSAQAPRPQSRGASRLPPTSSDGRRVIRYSRASYDYRAAIPEEVSFRKGDVLLVLHMQEDGWWEVEVHGHNRFGLAPSNFLANLN